jgi:hypothetical protein
MASSTDAEEPAAPASDSPGIREPAPDAPADPDAKRVRRPRKKIVIPVVFAVVGVILTIAAVGLYFLSTPGQLNAPSYATVELKSSFPIAELRYEVSPDKISSAVTDIRVFAQLPNNVLDTPAKATAAMLYLQLPSGVSFTTCPAGCSIDKNAGAYVWSVPLNFSDENTTSDSGVATASFAVRAVGFGYAANGSDAAAAIPQAAYLGPGSSTLELYTGYANVGAPDAYDWSGLPPQQANDDEIVWAEGVPAGGVPGVIDAGVNDTAQTQDGYKIFIAGALIGLAGGALLAALQEALHANDD